MEFSIIDSSNTTEILTVLVKNRQTVDDIWIRRLIYDQLMARNGVRTLIDELIANLQFVNQRLPHICYETEDLGLNEQDVVEVDLTKVIDHSLLHDVNIFCNLT